MHKILSFSQVNLLFFFLILLVVIEKISHIRIDRNVCTRKRERISISWTVLWLSRHHNGAYMLAHTSVCRNVSMMFIWIA